MVELKEAFVLNPLLFVIAGGVIVSLAVGLAILSGNSFAMRFLVKLGFPVFSGRYDKDFRLIKSFNENIVGVLKIPNTVYSPVFSTVGNEYLNTDFLGREARKGELRVHTSTEQSALHGVANESDGFFHDLVIIDGNTAVLSKNMQECRFTLLNRYIKSDLKKTAPVIHLYDGIKTRNLVVLFAVEMGLENNKSVSFKNRDDFLSGMRKMAFYDSSYTTEGNIVILRAKTDLDNLMVFLIDRGDNDVKI